MSTTVKSLSASEAEFGAWDEAAKAAGLTRNGWIRRALNETAALEAVLRRETEEDRQRAKEQRKVLEALAFNNKHA